VGVGRISLRTKLVLPLVALFLVAFALSAVFSGRLATDELIEYQQEDLEAQAFANVEILQTFLGQTRAYAENMASVAQWLPMTPVTQERFIRQNLLANPEVFGSTMAYEPFTFEEEYELWAPYYYRLPRARVAFAQLGTREYDYHNKAWYTLPKTSGRVVLSPPYFDEGGGDIWMVTWSAPFYNSKGRFQGVATADVSFDQVQRLIREIRLEEKSYALLVEGSTQRVLGISPNAPAYTVFEDSIASLGDQEWQASLPSILGGKNGLLETRDPLGQEAFVVYVPVGADTDWTLVLVTPRAVVETIGDNLRNQLLLAAAVVSVAATAGMLLFTGRLTAPIRQLATYVRAFGAEGGPSTSRAFPEPIQLKTGDEIEDLANAFNQVSGELQTLIHSLEDRIQERTRELQIARDEAEEANRTKSKFLASMSHELRTPLNSILNFSELVADGDLGPISAEQADALNEVVRNGEHLLSLINDILDLTKIEVGMMELLKERISLNPLLEGILSTGKGLAKDKAIQLESDLEPDLPLIIGDKRRIRQIFLNLISNAIKFTPQGSVRLSAKRNNGHVLVSVQDTGVGIAPQEQELIFESFRQGSHGVEIAGGTGLGLPITKFLVESHGGKLWLESAPGQGTTFYVQLPIWGAPQNGGSPKEG
jgi:signal transduction histidine kinase